MAANEKLLLSTLGQPAMEEVNDCRLFTLIDALPGIVFSCTHYPNWRMSYLSQGCFDLTGYLSEALAGDRRDLTYDSICHPEDLLKINAAIDRAVCDRTSYGVEYRIQTQSGQEKWVWEKGHALYDSDGNPVSLEGFISDITELKQVEKALNDQQAFLRLLLDNLPLAIFWKDTASVYQGCNQTMAKMYGLPSVAAIVGMTDFDLTNCQDARRYQAQDRRVIASNQPELSFLDQNLTLAGKQIWVNANKMPLHDAQGNVVGVLGTLQDVTEEKLTEDALRQAEQQYRSIFENVLEGIFQTTPTGGYSVANPMLANIYGYGSPEELVAALTDIEHQLYTNPKRRREFTEIMERMDAVWGFESQVYRKDGSVIWISENARAIRDRHGNLMGYEGTVEDITKRKQAEAELRQRDRLLQGVAAAANHLLTHTDSKVAINQALATLGAAANVDRVYIYQNHPHSQTRAIAMSMRYEWSSDRVAPSIQQTHWQDQPYSSFGMGRWYETLSTGRSISGIVREFPPAEQKILGLDGVLSILLVPIQMDEQLWGYIGFDDCHQERRWSGNEESILSTMAANIGGLLKHWQAEETIRYQAFHDLLTGLPNRMLFNDRMSLALASAHRHQVHPAQTMLAVMFLDLDRFKTINDTLGHPIGDLLLQAVAQRLQTCLREGDTLSRWGGDEFTLLLPQIFSGEDAAKIAHRISEVLKPAFYPDGHELYITSSIGIALYPNDGDDAETLLKHADAALYRVKEQGRNGFQLYTPAINFKASELLALENSLHHALERHEFLLHYQPQVNINTHEITRIEALIRWQHPELGFVPPNVFIPLAEENGLIVPIGDWVLRTACAQNKLWQMAGATSLRVAVNLSARQFQQPSLIETVVQILQDTQLDAESLELEVTETTAMQNVEFTVPMLKQLHSMGIHLSLDDFGTGYSSLGYLKKFPLDTLKIDQSFVRELTTDPNDAAIVRAVIALGQGLNLSVVAEGVETREQLAHLRSLNCREMQGYLFSRPMTAVAATQFLFAGKWKVN